MLRTKDEILARIQHLATKRFVFLRVPRLRRLMFWLSCFTCLCGFIVGCKFMCSLIQPIGEKFAATVVTQCVCSDATQVTTDIMTVINNDLVCNAAGCDDIKDVKAGPIWNGACSLAGNLLTGWLGGKIPATWGCTNSLGCVGQVVSIAVDACELIPVPLAPAK